jgi:hypothetical protein
LDVDLIHPGGKITYDSLKQKNKNITKEMVSKVLKRCIICQMYKSSSKPKLAQFKKFETPQEVGDNISVDISGHFLDLKEIKKYIILLINRISRYTWIHECTQSPTATQIIGYIKKTRKDTLGEIKRVLSDRESHFRSHIWI